MSRRIEAGFALLWAMMAILVTAAMLSAFIALVQGETIQKRHMILDLKAKSLALSGMHIALAKLNQDSGFAGIRTESWKVDVATVSAPPPASSPDFRLEDNQPEDWRAITVRARVGTVVAGLKAMAMAVYEPRCPAAVLSLEEGDVQNVSCDSYDGEHGDYFHTKSQEFGNIWSFRNLFVTLDSTTSIYGDCRAYDRLKLDLRPATQSITGSTRSLDVRYRYPIQEAPIDATLLQLKPGDTRLLQAGRYRIDALNLGPKTRMICTKGVVIYAHDVSVAPQSLVSLDSDPLSLQLIVSGHQVNVACPFTGVIEAPAAAVTVTNAGDFLGAIVGESVTLNPGVRFHFDRSLPRRTRGELKRWQAVSTSDSR